MLFLYFYPPGLTGISTQRPPTPRDVRRGEGSTPAKQDHHVTDRPSTLGLMIRPAARIIRELPPRRESYRVAVFFRAAPLAAPAVVRSTEVVESTDVKKAACNCDPGSNLAKYPSHRGHLVRRNRMCKRPSYLLLATATTSLYHKILIVRKYLVEKYLSSLNVVGCCWTLLEPDQNHGVHTGFTQGLRLNAMDINRQKGEGIRGYRRYKGSYTFKRYR